jgi:hypothetical protein
MAAASWHVPLNVPEMSTSVGPPSGPGVVPCSTAAPENVAVSPVTTNESDVRVNPPQVVFAGTFAFVPETVHGRVHEAGGSDVAVETSAPPSPMAKTMVAVSWYPLFVMYGHVHSPGPEKGFSGEELPCELAHAAPTTATKAARVSPRSAPAGITANRVAHPWSIRKSIQ